MVITKEEQLFLRHLFDLSRQSLQRNMDIYSDFLSVRETAIFKNHLADLPSGRFFLFGGVDEAERQVVCFPSALKEREELFFPICLIKVEAKGTKFRNISLKHSDFLGALLGLGIERKLLGDIFVNDEGNVGFVFCLDKITDFIFQELTMVGSFKVECSYCSLEEVLIQRRIEELFGTVPSLRMDAIVSEVFHLSRSKVKSFLEAGHIILNGAQAYSAHTDLKANDIVSLRGYGKFIFYTALGKTKKDKIKIHIGKYK